MSGSACSATPDSAAEISMADVTEDDRRSPMTFDSNNRDPDIAVVMDDVVGHRAVRAANADGRNGSFRLG